MSEPSRAVFLSYASQDAEARLEWKLAVDRSHLIAPAYCRRPSTRGLLNRTIRAGGGHLHAVTSRTQRLIRR
jgi:hypothetical protein